MSALPKFPWGAVQGEVALSQAALGEARTLALAHYEDAEAQDFCGDAVDERSLPAWLPAIEDWFPAADVAALGFARHTQQHATLLATVGVDAHEDHIHGPVLAWVLHNDGMTFKQGRQSHKTTPGEWFIFNDRVNHAVKEAKQSTSYVCIAVPLMPLD